MRSRSHTPTPTHALARNAQRACTHAHAFLRTNITGCQSWKLTTQDMPVQPLPKFRFKEKTKAFNKGWVRQEKLLFKTVSERQEDKPLLKNSIPRKLRDSSRWTFKLCSDSSKYWRLRRRNRPFHKSPAIRANSVLTHSDPRGQVTTFSLEEIYVNRERPDSHFMVQL